MRDLVEVLQWITSDEKLLSSCAVSPTVTSSTISTSGLIFNLDFSIYNNNSPLFLSLSLLFFFFFSLSHSLLTLQTPPQSHQHKAAEAAATPPPTVSVEIKQPHLNLFHPSEPAREIIEKEHKFESEERPRRTRQTGRF